MIGPLRALLGAAAFGLGVFAGVSSGSFRWLAAIAACSIGLLVTAWGLQARAVRGPHDESLIPSAHPVAVACALVGILCAGFAHGGVRERRLLEDSRLFARPTVVEMSAVVMDDPKYRGPNLGFIARTRRVDGRRLRMRLWISAQAPPKKVRLGDTFRGEFVVHPLDTGDDFHRYLRRVSVTGVADGSIDVVEPSANPLFRATNSFRERLRRSVTLSAGEEDAGMILGLTIGDDSLMSDRLRNQFRTAGLSHLTAVSGANVAMVLGAVLLLLQLAKTKRRTRLIAALATLTFFVLVTRWEASVLRASVMSAIAICAFFVGRRSYALHATAVAFLVLVAVDPFILWSVAFQLSFAATAGIVLAAAPLASKLPGPRVLAQAAGVTLAAQATVGPLLAFHFGTISLWSVPANLLAFPLVAPATVLGFAGGIVGIFNSHLAQPFISLSALSVVLIARIARAFSAFPSSAMHVYVDSWALWFGYLLVAALILLILRKLKLAALAGAGSVLIVFLAYLPASGSAPEHAVRFVFFDVGQGDAALVESPAGSRVLIDGGPDPSLLATLLRRKGIDRLDLVVASHAHADHVYGLGKVMAKSQVRYAIKPALESAALEGIGRFYESHDGERFVIGDLVAEVIGPAEALARAAETESSDSEGSALNDASLVIRISWGSGCALFPGDIEEQGQEVLARLRPRSIDCTLLKAPHHGSARLSPDFVRIVDPEWTVVSVGDNDYGHPTRTAMNLFQKTGGTVLRTDLEGDIVLEMDRKGSILRR